MVGPLAVWGVGTLVNQLLPPLAGFHDPDEQRRWRERVERSEPYLVDVGPAPARAPGLAGPDGRRERGHRADAVASAGGGTCSATPPYGSTSGYAGPRALVVGPWMHSAPDDAPDEPVDATALALRWWDRWLARDAPTPPVTVYVQGPTPVGAPAPTGPARSPRSRSP